MKVIKPQKLGVLSRTYEHGGACHFGVGLLLCAPFDAPRRLLAEMAMWKLAGDELGKNAGLDAGLPKARAEWLVCGKAFALGGTPRPGVRVRVKLGAADKTLVAVGDRYWKPGLMSGPSEPKPFIEMPIIWEHAFGGEGYAPNPLGKGFAPTDVGGTPLHLLPNVEDPLHPLASPDDRPPPAGFLPLDVTSPERMAKAGTYDQRWLEERFPGFPDNLAPTYFNAAPADQQIAGAFRGDETFVIENMHPHRPRIEGALPGFVTRCFVTQKSSDGEQLVEIPMRLDTVWLIPHVERAILVFHGGTRVREHDAADVIHLVAACEDPAAPKPVEHYRGVLGFPDVCLTPSPAGPVPVPYPNLAAGPMGVPAAYNVMFMCAPAHNMSTSVPLSNGDNAGLATGVASGTVMGPSRHLTAAFTVLVGGIPATRLTSMALQNNTNCPGARVVPSQLKVLLLAP